MVAKAGIEPATHGFSVVIGGARRFPKIPLSSAKDSLARGLTPQFRPTDAIHLPATAAYILLTRVGGTSRAHSVFARARWAVRIQSNLLDRLALRPPPIRAPPGVQGETKVFPCNGVVESTKEQAP